MSASYRHSNSLTFTQVDVFTSRKFEGNPLAVFHSGAGLSTAQMQAIAREMNLSETTFLLPPRREADARVRIFTVKEELPFAGHPTLGTAFVLASSRPEQPEIRLEMKAGIIPVSVTRRHERIYLEMRQRDPVFGSEVDRKPLAEALGVSESDLDPRYPPQAVSTGLPFLIVPLAASDALARLAPVERLLRPLLTEVHTFFPYYLVTGEIQIEARMFDSTFEDPATGSAAGCAAAYLVLHRRRRPDSTFVIRQGRFVSRPSQIYATASLSERRVHNVRIGGYVVEVLEGRLHS